MGKEEQETAYYTVDIFAGVGKWVWCEEYGQMLAVFRFSAQEAEDVDFPYTAYTFDELQENIRDLEQRLVEHGFDPENNLDIQLARQTCRAYSDAVLSQSSRWVFSPVQN